MIKKLFYMIIGALSLVGMLSLIIILGIFNTVNKIEKMEKPAMEIPAEMVLKIDFSNRFSEKYENEFSFEALKNPNVYPPFVKMIRAIKDAKDDKKIKGIYAILRDNSLGLSQVEEFRQAIFDFKKSGKKAIVYAPSMDFGLKDYYLASAFSEIWMSPNGILPITGISAKFPFVKNLLDKIGISPIVFAKYEYKGMMSAFSEDKMPKEIKENMEAMLGGVFDTMVSDISRDRNIEKNNLKMLINSAPFSTIMAIEKGLVDKALYPSDTEDMAEKTFGENSVAMDISVYIARPVTTEVKNKIAVLTLSGEIRAFDNFEGMANTINDKMVYDALNEIREIEDLKALVIRINSPGGAYDVADNIRYEITKFKKEKNIPIIASFSDTAASGGYFIATAVDKIYANKTTITGSIGAISARFDASKAIEKLGIGVETISYGANAGIFDVSTGMTEEQKKSLDALTENVYNDFAKKVGLSRNMDEKEVDNVARGRVFSGFDAFKVNLVDEIGGVDKVIDKAVELAKIKGETEIMVFPRQKTIADMLKSMIEQEGFLAPFNLNKIFFDMLGVNKIMLKDAKIEIK